MEKTVETIKMCDMSIDISTKVFEMLNPGKFTLQKSLHHFGSWDIFINRDMSSSDLIYPEGWFEAFGYFTNFGNSTNFKYSLAKIFEKCTPLAYDVSIYTLLHHHFSLVKDHKEKIAKLCDMPIAVSAKIFELLNPDKVTINEDSFNHRLEIIYNANPKDLIYPEGWYYTQGFFTNKYNNITDNYEKILMHM